MGTNSMAKAKVTTNSSGSSSNLATRCSALLSIINNTIRGTNSKDISSKIVHIIRIIQGTLREGNLIVIINHRNVRILYPTGMAVSLDKEQALTSDHMHKLTQRQIGLRLVKDPRASTPTS